MISINDIQVVKRDGNKEPWSFDKLVASIGKAGVPTEDAEKLGKEVEAWAQDYAKEGDLTSNNIRDKVIEVISADYPGEAESYKAYKKE